MGLLPHNILDLHPRELSLALKGQYTQLLVQYEELKSVPERGYFPTLFHKQYPGFTQYNIQECERTIDRLISSSQYTQSINTISACIEKTFSGITYYQRYQENILRVLISISLILSLLFNTVLVLQLFSGLVKMTGPSCSKFNTMNMLLLLLCMFSWWCQQLPLHFLFYYTAPVYMLTQLLGQLSTYNQSIKINREVVCILLFTVLICESVVFSFFDRRCLALGIGLIATSFIFRYIYCNLSYSGKLLATSFLYSKRRNLVQGLSILLAGGFSWFPAIDGRLVFSGIYVGFIY
ncbi:uncharacterized protein LOC111714091 isoform X2 [Eurytemora carolleeae]|uniref:uncharacterized protein LOC111714091 isoform X2 n=1 Tax=Eurytemora carolleeae TaxID=1294199 RepID=UPI000C75FC0F|nr:uncharacterized protein LOC111714091 isoform X2 [Eurytemora carolleeae]|eukprot:XP_023344898.1 uncharacterized protein LOC111714091 isoform X2 [Eurytemora affinis]